MPYSLVCCLFQQFPCLKQFSFSKEGRSSSLWARDTDCRHLGGKADSGQLVWRGKELAQEGSYSSPFLLPALLGQRRLRSSGEHHITVFRAWCSVMGGTDPGDTSCWAQQHCWGHHSSSLLALDSHGVALGRLLGVALPRGSKKQSTKLKFWNVPFKTCPSPNFIVTSVLSHLWWHASRDFMLVVKLQICSRWCWKSIFLLRATSHKCNRTDVDLFYPGTHYLKSFFKHLFLMQ